MVNSEKYKFLLLIKDNNNTLKLPNKKCKNVQLYIDNQ